MPKEVIVFYQPGCAPCHQAMEFLSQRGIPFTAKNIRADPAAMRELIEAGFSMTPVIRVDGEVLVGFDPDRLDVAIRNR